MQPSRIPDGGSIRVEGDLSAEEIERRFAVAYRDILQRRLAMRETVVDDWPTRQESPRLARAFRHFSNGIQVR